jgi:hypothetical protein
MPSTRKQEFMVLGAAALVVANTITFAAAASEVLQDIPSILTHQAGLREQVHLLGLLAAMVGLAGLWFIWLELRENRIPHNPKPVSRARERSTRATEASAGKLAK